MSLALGTCVFTIENLIGLLLNKHPFKILPKDGGKKPKKAFKTKYVVRKF